MQSRPRAWALLVVILLAALAVRLHQISQQSIWFDEGWSAYAAVQPTLADAAAADATNPPLYYILLNLHARFLGDSPFSLRLFSTFVGLLGVALTFRLAYMFFSLRAGLFAALLTAVSPLLWWAGQEARMYTLLALLVTAAAFGWHRLLRRRPSRGAWVVLWAAELALLYAHNTGPVVALWLNAVTLLAWLGRRRADRPDWRVWLAGQAAVGLLWLPYFASRFLTLAEANSAVQTAPRLNLALLADVWSAFWAGSWALVGREPLFATVTTSAPYVGLPGIALVLALALVPWRRAAARWLVVHVLVLFAGLLLGLVVLGNELHGRYLAMVAPLLLVPVGAGLARLRPRALGWLISLIFVGIFALAVRYSHDPLYGHDDVSGTVRFYADTLGSDDTVLAWSYADRYELAYYWPRFGVQAARVTLPEGADLDAVVPLLPDGGDVALNVWYTQRADYRGMLSCVLAHGTRTLPQEFTTYGMTSLVYRAPSLDIPRLEPRPADFGIAQLLAVGKVPAFPSDRALCLPVQIRLADDTPADLQAALIVRNALGWEVARADAIFATANQRTSTMVEAGTELTAYPLLRLPFGAPSGDYELILRVYDPERLSGYEVTSAGATPGRDLLLGTWTAPPGQQWRDTGRAADVDTTGEIMVNGLSLRGISLPAEGYRIATGETLRLALLWEGVGDLPLLMLTDAGERWSFTLPPPARDTADITLDWREARIPASADAGPARLHLPDGRTVASLLVDALPYLGEPPPFTTAYAAEFSGVGSLIGYTLDANPASMSQDVPLALVWQAGDDAPSDIGYTVFAQLLDADGRLLAQSDSVPADGARPTTGWRPGEYIVDSHILRWNANARPGPATLIVGWYDAATGTRLMSSDGLDHIRLPSVVEVVP